MDSRDDDDDAEERESRDGEEAPQYEGEVGSDGQPHGLGALHFPDGSSMGGQWVEGELHGPGEYSFPDGSRIVGEWAHGELAGQVEELDADGRVRYRGRYAGGQRDGAGQLWYHDEGAHISGTWYQGHLQGPAVYQYPDGSTLRGTWDQGELVSAAWYDKSGLADPKHRQYCFLGVGEDVGEADDGDDDEDEGEEDRGDHEEEQAMASDAGAKSNGSGESAMGVTPKQEEGTNQGGKLFTLPHALVRDAYEEQYVYVDDSRVPHSGQGLFAARDIEKDTIFSFYAGQKITHEANDRRLWLECSNAISLDDDAVIDVPRPFDRLDQYCASLGHKANHASPPENNCIYFPYDSHPVFGRIKCLRSVRPIKQGEEMLVDYGYEAHDAPEWWVPPAATHKRKAETSSSSEATGDTPQLGESAPKAPLNQKRQKQEEEEEAQQRERGPAMWKTSTRNKMGEFL